MFLNFLAGAIALVLAVSAFTPWVTVWFYSLKGIDSAYGIAVLLVGIFGALIAVFQHLSGKIRGRAFMLLGLAALAAEGLYARKLASIGSTLNDVFTLLKDLFGDAIAQKAQQHLGDQWMKVLNVVIKRAEVDASVSATDFLGGGLVLAGIGAIALLVIGAMIEKNKTVE
jgi:hypothetical protein